MWPTQTGFAVPWYGMGARYYHKAVEMGSIQAHMKCTVVVEVGEGLTSTAVGID
jgi:hypothetical protein